MGAWTASGEQTVAADATGRTRLQQIIPIAVALSALVVYANSIANGFVLDDRGVVLDNPLVTFPAQSWRAFAHPYWPEQIGGGQYRPLGIISFALDWAVSGGDPRWFHVVNVLWHVGATVAVWRLAARLLAPVGAVVTALVFAVHSVHVEAVSNVVGRLECMAALFVLAALLAHQKGAKTAPLWFALGLLSKESAIVFVALAAAHDVLLEREWRAALAARRWWYASYAVVAVLYAVLLAAVFHDQEILRTSRMFDGATIAERLTLVTSVIPHYARLLVAPMELSATYAPHVISWNLRPSANTLLGVGVLLVSVVAFVAAVRKRWIVMAFALIWVPVALAPVSNVVFATGILLAERTLYLPSVGICLAAGAVVDRFLAARPQATMTMVAAVLLALTARTWTRTPVWRDSRTFLLNLLADHPEAYDAHLAAGRVLKGAGQLDQAQMEFAISRRLFPRDPMIYREAADAALRQKRPELAAALLDSARLAPTLLLKR